MIRLMKLTGLILPLLLAACTPSEPARGAVARLKPELAEAVHSYRFNECSGTMPMAERAKIYKFLRNLWLTSDDVIIVSLPKGRNATRDLQRRRTMKALLAPVPGQKRFVGARDFRDNCAARSEGIIRVVRTLSVRADCSGGQLPNGCRSAQNLAAMMSRPADAFLPPQPAKGAVNRKEE